MNDTNHLTPDQVVDRFREQFGTGLLDAKITERGEGTKKVKAYNIWLRVDRESLPACSTAPYRYTVPPSCGYRRQ